MTSNFRWFWSTPLISNKSDGQYQAPCVLKCDAIAHKSEMWIKRNTNKPFPKFHCNPVGSRSGKYMGRNMKISQNKSKTSVSPNFIVRATPPPTLSLFLDTLWWTLVNKSCSTSILLYVGGLINRFPPFWCPTSHSILPLLFLHHGGRGCGSRLSICQLNIYNKYWDGNAVYVHPELVS